MVERSDHFQVNFRIHYNFVRNHSTIGKTPAEQAGIKLELGENKIESLIKLASKLNYHESC